jgi:hypothetical protein
MEDHVAVRREASSSYQEERQEQEETLQDGMKTLFHFAHIVFFS